MAFNINPGKQQFSATASQTVFTFNFAIFASTDLKVYKTLAGAVANDTADLLTLSTHYTVSINGTLGGTVTLLSGASLNDTITVVRSLPITRSTDYVTNGDLYADTLDLDQDYQTYLVLDQNVLLQRAIIVPESAGGIDLSIPTPTANAYLRWNATADALENDVTIPQAVIDSAASAANAATSETNSATSETNSATSETNSQLRAWEAEAERMTADSYATEAEDVFVKVYTSDGDGTFTATNTTEYSAFHWNAKAFGNSATTAVAVSYDNTTSGLTAVNAQTAIDEISLEKAPLSSPGFTGTPTAPTATAGTNTTQLATTAFVQSATTSANIQLGTAVTASGTAVDFIGIPAGAKRVSVKVVGLSTSGTSPTIVQLGTISGIEATGYTGSSFLSSNVLWSTGAILVAVGAATEVYHGGVTFELVFGSTWEGKVQIGRSNVAYSATGAGNKTLSGVLDRIRVTQVNGTDTFDAGTINISWEF